MKQKNFFLLITIYICLTNTSRHWCGALISFDIFCRFSFLLIFLKKNQKCCLRLWQGALERLATCSWAVWSAVGLGRWEKILLENFWGGQVRKVLLGYIVGILLGWAGEKKYCWGILLEYFWAGQVRKKMLRNIIGILLGWAGEKKCCRGLLLEYC